METEEDVYTMNKPGNRKYTSTQSTADPHTHRPVSPVPSCVSMKSDGSLIEPLHFSSGTDPSRLDPHTRRPVSPVTSGVSMKSDGSLIEPLHFSSGTDPSAQDPHTRRPVSPVPSGVSMRSDGSLIEPLHFSSGTIPSALDPHTRRPVSPVPSGVSMKSDGSLIEPLHFSSGTDPSAQDRRPVSPVPSGVSMKSDGSLIEPLHFSSGTDPSAQDAHTRRPVSPVPSCVSMKSDGSLIEPLHFSSGTDPSRLDPHTHRPVSAVPSGVSMKSDGSLIEPLHFSRGTIPSALDELRTAVAQDQSRCGPTPSGQKFQSFRPPSPVPSGVSMKTDMSKADLPNFSAESALLGQNDVRTVSCGVCKQVLRDPVITTTCGHSFCRQCISTDWEQPGPPGDQACPQCGKKPRTQPPLQPPLDDEHTDRAGSSRHMHSQHKLGRKRKRDKHLGRVKQNHKASLKKKFEIVSEGIFKPGAETLLNKIYTELYITEGESEGVNKEHEVWQVESASRTQTTFDTPINCNDIFKCLPEQQKHIRTVMTKGVAGIGKTVSVQKFVLDWTDGIANQNVDFVFPLSFRELNLVRGDQYSLHKLLLDFHPELKELNDSEEYKDGQVLIIFDGLDESRLTLDFEQNIQVCDVKQTSSVDVLMTSLIKGTLFPSALIWITSRPAAAGQIPPQYIDQVTEVRGFNDQQKEEFFRKRINDQNQANRIIKHIKTSRSLHILCHIPVFCWISVTVLQQIPEQDNNQEIPKTLTEMFVHFLLIQITRKDLKYQESWESDNKELLESNKVIILKLAELALKNLLKGNLMFYEEDLRECDIDVHEASVYSGLCTKIFKEESVFHQRKIYSFVHLTVQEFLAALHVFVSFKSVNENLYSLEPFVKKPPLPLEELLEKAADEALQSKNGHLDLFLRFLMGISLERNHRLLQGLLKHPLSSSESIKKTCKHIKELNKDGISPERCINLFFCLLEMNDHSMHHAIKEYLESPMDFKGPLSPAHCSALAHMLLMSEEVLDEFDLKKGNISDEGCRRLIPVLRYCRKARCAGCNLTNKSCENIASVLQSPNSLIELDLSTNDLGDFGVQTLSKGLFSPHCKLQTLRLSDCKMTKKTSGIMASVLKSPNSLIELDLSHNNLGNSGVQHLSTGLSSPHCKLQTLRYAGCNLTNKSCANIASVLQSPNSLIELDLSLNDLGDSGVQLLSKGLSSPHCQLQTLRLSDCLISEKGSGFLASALTSNPSHLKELDLRYNHLGESGLTLSARPNDPYSKLEIFRTDHASSRARPRLLKYACKLKLDQDTAHRNLSLSEVNRKVTHVNEEQPYPDHPERFDYRPQVLCREGLSGRCYWEAEWSGDGARIAVAYKSIKRLGRRDDVIMGCNAESWSLIYFPHSYSACHNNKHTVIPAPSSRSRRVGVYLDWQAGTLSFYSVSSDTLTHLHTFHSTFTEPLYPGFSLFSDSSVTLCQIP